MARSCQCWKTYTCLYCEAKALHAERAAREPKEPRERKPANRKIPECGTRSGYNRHLRLKEPTCELCRAAQSESAKRFYKEKVNG
jgi:hypothetical protein